MGLRPVHGTFTSEMSYERFSALHPAVCRTEDTQLHLTITLI